MACDDFYQGRAVASDARCGAQAPPTTSGHAVRVLPQLRRGLVIRGFEVSPEADIAQLVVIEATQVLRFVFRPMPTKQGRRPQGQKTEILDEFADSVTGCYIFGHL